MAKSAAKDFTGESHFMRILSDPRPPADEEVKRLVLCSGKVAYDLIEARDAAKKKDISIVRLEQLYPFPGEPLALRLSRMTNLKEVVWCQEEPRNNGAWFFVASAIESALEEAGSPVERVRYAGRAVSASPATGLAKRHEAEQAALIADALGLSVRSEIRRRKKS
jgi:2-oxoglutarate dehydrogenase E1 component